MLLDGLVGAVRLLLGGGGGGRSGGAAVVVHGAVTAGRGRRGGEELQDVRHRDCAWHLAQSFVDLRLQSLFDVLADGLGDELLGLLDHLGLELRGLDSLNYLLVKRKVLWVRRMRISWRIVLEGRREEKSHCGESNPGLRDEKPEILTTRPQWPANHMYQPYI